MVKAFHKVKVVKAISGKKYALGAFMNVESASKCAQFEAIYDATGQHRINPPLIIWILHVQEYRKIGFAKVILVRPKQDILGLLSEKCSFSIVMAPSNRYPAESSLLKHFWTI